MLQFNVSADKDDGIVSLILLWFFKLTIQYDFIRGAHTSIGVRFLPIEFSFQVSWWDKWVP